MALFDRITGRSIEAKLDEYEAVYGEVLLGMHRDLKLQAEKLAELQAELLDQRRRINDLGASLPALGQFQHADGDLMLLSRRSRAAWRTALAAILLAAISLLVSMA